MSTAINAHTEMAFFSLLVRAGSLSAAARELDVTTAGVSKRLSQMEARLGARLLHRTTRRIGLTAEGEIYLANSRRILADIEDMEQQITSAGTAPKGLLRVNATPGFGRSHIAPLISAFHKRCPEVHIQLQLTVDPPSLVEDACDVWIRFGEPPDTRVIARFLASNRRLICGAPAYLDRHGAPRVPNDLTQHSCIGIRQGEEGYGTWHLTSGQRSETVKVRGSLNTNDGEIAVNWALEGHGLIMRAQWDVARYLQSGRLRQVLPNWETPLADIHAVYPYQLQTAARVRSFVDFVADAFSSATPMGHEAPR